MAHPTQGQVPPRTFQSGHPGQGHNGVPINTGHPPVGQQPGFALPGPPLQGVNNRPQGPPTGRAASFSSQITHHHSQPASPYSIASPGYGPASPNASSPPNAPSSYQSVQPASNQQPHFAPVINRNPPHNPHASAGYSRPPHPQYSPSGAATPTTMAPAPSPAPNSVGQQQQPHQQQPHQQQPHQQQPQQQQYTNHTFAPAVSAPPTPGTMGPPTGRPQREYEYDVTDSLMGTGVNIREEENALADYYTSSYAHDVVPENVPGNLAWTQAGEAIGGLSQKEYEAREAERQWNDSANRLAATRAVEHNNPFLNYAGLHARMEKIAKGHNLDLNLDNKNNPQQAHVQKSRNLNDYPAPKVSLTTLQGPDVAIVEVNGSVVPTDSYLADQLALVSLATKHRIRGFIADCDKLATHRQQSSHGVIPMAWSEDGLSLDAVGLYDPNDIQENGAGESGAGESGAGGNGAGDGAMVPKKRKPTVFIFFCFLLSGDVLMYPAGPLNPHSQYLRDWAREERRQEEERIRKRQKRHAEEAAAQAGSRAGSSAPTPGSSAPEPDKAPTKKEAKKIAAQKHDASAESVNSTTAQFLGGKKKKYSWMTDAAAGPRTPTRPAGGAASTPTSAAASKAPENRPLTAEPRNTMGTWREYSEKGKNIQLRDWIKVLERDNKDALALYKAREMQRRS